MTLKSPRIHATELMRQFRCVGQACEDSCCTGWEIELDDATLRRYNRVPALRHVHEPKEGAAGHRMCRDGDGNCLQHVDGLCVLLARYGDDFLSETCHFFPRAFRLLGEERLASVMLSCPEAARMALFGERMFDRSPIALPRPMSGLTQYLPAGMPFDTAYRIHDRVLRSLDDGSLSAEAYLSRLLALAYALDDTAQPDWEETADFYLRLPPAAPTAPVQAGDLFSLAHTTLRLAIGDGVQYRPRLYRTIRDMEVALELTFHWKHGTMETGPRSGLACQAALATWRRHAGAEDSMLRNWLRAQLARTVFPFGGLGKKASEQAYALTIAFVTTRLALLCMLHAQEGKAQDGDRVRVVQSLARIFEHIEDFAVFGTYYPHLDPRRQEPLQRLLRLF